MPTAFADILDSVPATGLPIEALVELANHALDAAHVAVDDGRATERLDVRTVRFYQTLGVLPKPEYEGRRALYSLTHLVRLVAAKRLQAEGHSLAQIQAALPARTDAQLVRALTAMRTSAASSAAAPAGPSARSRTIPPAQPPAPAAPATLHAFTLAPGITLMIDPAAIAARTGDAAARDPAAIASALAAALASLPATTSGAKHPAPGHRTR